MGAKARKVLDAGMTPILCCGEALEIRKAGTHVDFVLGQIRAALEGWSGEDVAKIVIAYEPIWAIGTGETATAEDAQEVCGAIREALRADYGDAPPTLPVSSTAAPPSPATSRSSWPSPTSTARSSAEPPSRRIPSPPWRASTPERP